MFTIRLLSAVLQDRKGISSLEYGILAVGILTGLFTAVQFVKTPLDAIFSSSIPSYL